MAREEQAIFMNLCMVYDGQGNVLVQNRKNPNWSGITFPGGHVEAGESFADAVKREVWEETGLTIENPKLCGTKQFQTRQGERYVVFFYILNFLMVGTDLCLYYRNYLLDKKRAAEESKAN